MTDPDSAARGLIVPNLCVPQAVFFAVLLAEVVVLLHVLALGPLAQFDWRTLATASLFVQWNTLLCVALLCWTRRPLQGLGPIPATLAALALVALVGIGSSLAVYVLGPLQYSREPGLLDWCLRNALLAVILAAVVLRYSYLQQRVAMQQRSELQLRLDALRSRIRPHFLFNTLNSIASLISVQPARAERAIEDIAELFRAALAERESSSLGDELHLCELYLDIEKLRLGERLRVAWSVDDTLRSRPIPPLLVQPLVENAIYHGVSQLPAGGVVSIACQCRDGFLVVEVRNPLPPDSADAPAAGHRMALDNIRQRLDALYTGRAFMKAGAEDGQYVARLELPEMVLPL
jgi:two-component system sensor histidine kinase AlgZ